MPITIINKESSRTALLEPTGDGAYAVLRPYSFPSETVEVPSGVRLNLIRVPMLESPEGRSLISAERAREVIPITEAIGKNLESYLIESFPEGEGGQVNGVKLEIGVPTEDLGIVFTGT